MALCDDCLSAFKQYESKELQVYVDENFPAFACEQCRVSDYSPGPVQDDESVVFVTIHPVHYDQESGVLSPIAFEQLTRNDLSVLRYTYATEGEYKTVTSVLKSGGSKAVERKVEKCCFVPVREVRGVSDGRGRVFGLYDTALKDIPAHASVFVRGDYLENKAAKMQARYAILNVFKNHLRDLAAFLPRESQS